MPLEIVRNDITRMEVDAIVNAANNALQGGGGVDGAIHRAAGPRLLEECRTLNGCETGQAKITRGYNLPCQYVIHTVGPVWKGGGQGERALLAACYQNSLALAKEYHCETVAFPLISAGVYGYPKAEAMQVAVDEISRFLLENDMTVYIVVFTRDTVELGGKLFKEVAAYIDDVYVAEHYDADREARRSQRVWKDMPRPTVGGGLFRRAHREDTARNETIFADADLSAGAVAPQASLEDMLGQVDEGFSEMLLRKIDEKGLTDAACYKRANVDRRLFNKIKNNPAYRPSKQTALAFAIALELPMDEARELLMKAGYALTHSSKADIVVEYCIMTGNYNLIEINQVLFRLDLQPLGY
ncbi:MAG: O-acetyl-ADP-ribose deacetylase [Clostridia bacterium]|nr:O-acetyl-ADP-ribose deacetylase [Clostridia bacterium]